MIVLGLLLAALVLALVGSALHRVSLVAWAVGLLVAAVLFLVAG